MLLGEGLLELGVEVSREITGRVGVFIHPGLGGGGDGLHKGIPVGVDSLGVLGADLPLVAVVGLLPVGEVAVDPQAVVKELGGEGGGVPQDLVDGGLAALALEEVTDGVDAGIGDSAVLVVDRG